MEEDLKQRIEKYVKDKYTVEQRRIRQDYGANMAALPQRGRGNGAYSTYADNRHVKLYRHGIILT